MPMKFGKEVACSECQKPTILKREHVYCDPECDQCSGSGISYWSDGVYGWCLDCIGTDEHDAYCDSCLNLQRQQWLREHPNADDSKQSVSERIKAIAQENNWQFYTMKNYRFSTKFQFNQPATGLELKVWLKTGNLLSFSVSKLKMGGKDITLDTFHEKLASLKPKEKKSALTEEQRQRIERNRLAAIERPKEFLAKKQSTLHSKDSK